MPVVDFTADNTTVSPGDIVQFTRDENDPMEIGAYPVCSTHNLPVEDYT